MKPKKKKKSFSLFALISAGLKIPKIGAKFRDSICEVHPSSIC